MRKAIIILVIILTTIAVNAQTISEIPKKNLSFEKVIQTENINKTDLFISVNEWFATSYNSANDVIQMSDKEAGKIIGKGVMNCNMDGNSSYDGKINYTINVAIKDNRYKVILSNFTHTGKGISLGLITNEEIYSTKGMLKKYNNKAWKDIKLMIEDYCNNIFTDISKKANNSNTDDDW